MSEILQDIQRKLIFPLDFPSQKFTETVQQVTLLVGAILACNVGCATQSLKHLLIIYGISCLIAAIAVLPAYPAYTKKKLQWVQPEVASVSSN
ncbi:SPC1 (YJR010C-A) [Zygosaccharomyces parabailii]|uniref:Signal peptidase complex subunit 1 n=1 Tax=Zygosaccharomyces bailii (strain CLIB 213 / ATCC 58445 / CBS 680 / BCRC 21525 / NBRC 1098 / NCYC 1416 / NRRL Y-2227) TaxID=1333698 RepID=A0A8J2T3L6_ZYGB2|nr:SPC1 (YJR010C-A) [Zygosaccharomyces parabailii]CDF87459.1 BN860_06854g1_1 [Zygosaccharomyces bailii CLIB 213]SJM85157.1 probable Signal peptidase complex subunit SPC1 [Zygosaccharomyces bailii]